MWRVNPRPGSCSARSGGSMASTSLGSSDAKPMNGARRSTPPPVRIDVSALTHPGHVRDNNEDHFFVAKATRALETMLTSLPAGTLPGNAAHVNYVMAVADGMGGHAAGEVASRMALEALVNLVLDIPDWIFWVDGQNASEIERRARRAVELVGSKLIELGREDASLRGMGCTLTAA